MNDNITRALERAISEASKMLQKIVRDSKRMPEGHLEVSLARGKYLQCYAVEKKHGKLQKNYISVKERKIAEQLAQKAYLGKAKKALIRRKQVLEKACLTLRETDLKQVYDRESPERRKLITPLVSTDEQYIEQWYEEHKGGQNSFAKTTAYTTVKGETVRSKSEKMIADAYHAAGVPYVYEPTVMLSNGKTKYPDFAVLNVRLRKTMYHEHFGMMDDDEYRQNAMLKIREYNKNGYPIGDCLLCTFEGENIPFDQDELNELIRVFLL